MAVCNGLCVFGKCPNKECVRHNKSIEPGRIGIKSRILESISEKKIPSDKTGYGFAVDIGTTTVVVYLVKMDESRCIAVKSELNNQITLGVDVISRINYASSDNGLDLLHDIIVNQLNNMFYDLCVETGIAEQDISSAVITGNTTMLHLLEGLSPVSMGVLPFKAESLFGYERKATNLGLSLSNSFVYLTPCMSAFVGGDITSAVLASGLCNDSEISLLMDLGTNGELVLGNKENIFTTSTAAGPAFEGSQIEKGMAGVNGAVNSVYPDDGSIVYDVIGNIRPQGICGSGILDLTSLFVSIGCIDEAGFINDATKYIKKDGDKNIIFLDDNVYLTQKDIRQIQTAKAAVAAGVKTLAADSGILIEEISHVYIAGGFGNFMNQESAIGIGLLDKCFAGKTECIGNGAGTGAIMMLLNDRYKEESVKIANLSEHIELGGNPVFMNEYVENMMF